MLTSVVLLLCLRTMAASLIADVDEPLPLQSIHEVMLVSLSLVHQVTIMTANKTRKNTEAMQS